MKKFFECLIAGIAVFALFSGCEVGLGSAVDTQPPLVSVESPTADYIIKDAFVISGTCSDEQGLASISVSLKNTSTKKSYDGYKGVIDDKNGTWSCSIDPFDEENPIPDGTYEATVTATDLAKRTSKASKSFAIDNTAPLLVLTRPSTKPSDDGSITVSDTDTYGQEFDITGQVADDNNIDKLVVTFYDQNKNQIYKDAGKTVPVKVELSNVPPTIDLAVATYSGSTDDASKTDYDIVYDNRSSQEDATGYYFCKITIYDEARHCPEIENDEGNCSSDYYLYNDIYDSILANYKVTQVYHMMNGTVEMDEAVQSSLEANKVDTATFSLNPNNQPTYTISGFDPVLGTSDEISEKMASLEENCGIYTGSQMTVKFSTGLDKTPLVQNSLGLYLLRYTKNESGEYVLAEDVSANRIWIIQPAEDALNRYSDAIGTKNRDAINKVGSYDYTATVTMDSSEEGLDTGAHYAVIAVGYDKKNETRTAFVSGVRYGFYLQSAGSVPILKMTSPASTNLFLKKGDGVTVTGTLSNCNDAVPTYTLELEGDGDTEPTPIVTEAVCTQKNGSDTTYEFNYEISSDAFVQDTSKNYVLYVRGICGSAEVLKQFTIGYDVDGPNIEIASVSPYAKEEASGDETIFTVNGTFGVKVRTSDDFYKMSSTERTVVEVFNGDVSTDCRLETFQSNFTYEIDSKNNLSSVEDGTNLTIKVTAYDYSGNVSEKTQKIILDQSSDKPVVTLTNAVLEGYSESYPESGTSNVFMAGAPITATVQDDDGIAEIAVNYYTTDGTLLSTKTFTKDTDIKYNPYSLTVSVPEDLDTYIAEIIVKDTEYGTTNDSCKFYFMVDSGNPTIVINPSSSGKYFGKKSGPIEVTGTVTGLGGLKIYRTYTDSNKVEIDKNSDGTADQPVSTATQAQWTDMFIVPDVEENADGSATTNTYTVVDKKNRTSTALLTYYVDNTKPAVTISTEDSLISADNFKFTGSAEDPSCTGGISGSGINSIWYKILSDSESAPAAAATESAALAAGWTKLSGTGSWNFYQTFRAKGSDVEDALDEGAYKLYVVAYDAAQNASAIASHTFTVDLSKPEISAYYEKSGETSYTEITNSACPLNKAFTFRYKIADSYGLSASSCSIKRDETVLVKDTDYTVSEETTGSGASLTATGYCIVTFEDSSLTDGTYTFTLSGTDLAGQVSTVTKTIILDTEAPVITVTSPEDGEWQSKKSVTIRGTAEDVSSISAVYYRSGSAEYSSENGWTEWTKLTGKNSWSFTTPSSTSEGTTVYSIAAEDEYGNISAVSTKFTLKVDVENPKIGATSFTPDGKSAETLKNNASKNINCGFTLSGTASDSLALKNVVLSWGTENGQSVTWNNSATSYSWSKSFVTGSSNAGTANYLADGSYTFTLTVTDSTGSKTAEETYTVVVDTVAPVITNVVADWGSGATASSNDYYKVSSPTLKVVTDDATSGVAAVYCLASQSLYYSDSDTDSSHTKVSAAGVDSSMSSTGNTNEYSRKLSLSDGTNYAYIKVEDQAGNAAYYGDSTRVTMLVDTTGPVITFSSPNVSSMLSTKADCEYTVEITDALSGVSGKTATVQLVGIKSNANATQTVTVDSNGKITGTFAQSVMDTISTNSETLKVTVSDDAGNENSSQLTLTFDNEAPTVKINNPALSTVNGTIKISGTATDNISVSSVKVYRTKLDSETADLTVDSTDYILLKEFTGTDAYNWSIDSFATSAFADGSSVTFYVAAEDSAQNKGTETKTVTIDQDSDRPEIKITNASLEGMTSTAAVWHKQSSIYGTVTDDDGVEALYISTDGTNWSDNLYDSGAWSYDLTDGSNTLYFKVIDSSNSTSRPFVSSASSSAGSNTPRISDSKGKTFGYKTGSENANTILHLKVDTEKPTISKVYFRVTEPTAESYDLSDHNDWISADQISSSNVIGGPGKYLYLLVESKDANGIASNGITLKDKNGTVISGVTISSLNSPSATTNETVHQEVFKFATDTKSDDTYLLSGSTTIVVTATDQAGASISENLTATVDNSAPTFNFTSHSDGAVVYGSEKNTIQGNSSDAKTAYFAVTKDTTVPSDSDWTEIDSYVSALNWGITFALGQNTSSNQTEYYTNKGLNDYLKDFGYETENDATAVSEPVYIWVKGSDELGNESTPVYRRIIVNPKGDKPTLEITYPTTGSTLGGSIRITGTASTITSSVSAVYLQIDPSYDSTAGFNTSGWKSELETLIEGKSTGYSISTSEITGIGYAIGTGGNPTSWYLSINSANELKGTSNTYVGIRVYAVSETGKVSEPAEVHFTIDPNSPVISNLELVQYEKTSGSGVACTDGSVISGTVVNRKPYVSGMWITGVWILEADITDDSGIMAVNDGDGNAVASTYLEDLTTPAGTTYKNKKLHLPVGSSTGSGTVSMSLLAYEGNENIASANHCEASVSLKYDNTKPALNLSDKLPSTDVNVINSNGWYTVNGTVEESDSGFSSVAFYFTRTLNDGSKDVTYLIDPWQTDRTSNRVDVSTLTNTDGLYFSSYTVSSVDNTKITLSSSVSSDSFIRTGGLVKIMGSYYTILSISDDGKEVNLDSTVPDAAAEKTALFAIAFVVDHQSTESWNSSTSKITGDDGDGLIEAVDVAGSTATWSASVNSTNIPDGSITIGFAAFDKAGNIKTSSVTGDVTNNRPRIAGVSFGSDNNGDGEVLSADDEIITTYSGLFNKDSSNKKSGVTVNGQKANGDRVYSLTLPESDNYSDADSVLKLRGNTIVIPEIVGGNDGLSYTYNFSNGNKGVSTPVSLTSVDSRDDSVRTQDLTVSMTLENLLENGVQDAEGQDYTLKLWDNTEGKTAGTDSQFAQITLKVDVALRDNTAPEAVITPFYWNTAKNNSAYTTSLTGHIELADDLPSLFKSGSTGLYDRDAKVSGTIKLEGTASDNGKLTAIKINISGITSDYVTFAERADDGSWTTSDLSAYGITAPSAGAISNEKFDNTTGNSLNWTLYVNTANVTNVAATDVNIQVKAVDMGCATWDSTDKKVTYADGNEAVDASQVDIVPYITKIQTPTRSASGLKDSNIRSASGKYSVIKGSTAGFITVTGWNLNPSAARIVDTSTVALNSVSATSGVALTVTTPASPYTSVGLSNAGTKSGYLELIVNGIRTLNNINSNNAHGSFELTGEVEDYANMPNREADYYTTKNIQLTDDRYIRFFDMKDTGVQNGYYPTMIMNGDNPVFGYVDLNGGKSSTAGTAAGTGAGTYQATNAMPQRAEFNGSTASEVYTEYLGKALSFDQMAMAVDEDGRYIQSTVSNYSGDYMAIYYDRYNELQTPSNGYGWCGYTMYSGYGGDYASYGSNNAIVIDSIGSYTGRFQYPKLIAKGKTRTGTGNIYMAYYDAQTGNLYFRDFMIGGKLNVTTTGTQASNVKFTYNSTLSAYLSSGYGPTSSTTLSGVYTSSNGTTDYDGYYVLIDGNYYELSGSSYYTSRTSNTTNYYYTLSYTGNTSFTSDVYSGTSTVSMDGNESGVLNALYSGGTDNNGYSYGQYVNFNESTSDTSTRHTVVSNASKYYALGVTSDYHVIIVYYDESNSRLKMLYSTNAVTGSDPTADVAWTSSTLEFPEYVGNYVSMALDSKDGIHISAFDAGDSDLSYIYIPTYKASSYTHYTVDQYGAVGNWTQIKVNSANQPVIAYTNATENGQRDAIKLAVSTGSVGTNAIGEVAAGVDENNYTTGKWEYMTVPAKTPPQGGDSKFQNVCLDFDSSGRPVVGYLGTDLEFGKWIDE